MPNISIVRTIRYSNLWPYSIDRFESVCRLGPKMKLTLRSKFEKIKTSGGTECISFYTKWTKHKTKTKNKKQIKIVYHILLESLSLSIGSYRVMRFFAYFSSSVCNVWFWFICFLITLHISAQICARRTIFWMLHSRSVNAKYWRTCDRCQMLHFSQLVQYIHFISFG